VIVRSAPPVHATPSRIGPGSLSTHPTLHASSSTPEASLFTQVLVLAHKDDHKCEPKTCNAALTPPRVTSPPHSHRDRQSHSFLLRNPQLFSRRCLTRDSQNLSPPGGVRPARVLGSKPAILHTLSFWFGPRGGVQVGFVLLLI
jgi:hypothetical protein